MERDERKCLVCGEWVYIEGVTCPDCLTAIGAERVKAIQYLVGLAAGVHGEMCGSNKCTCRADFVSAMAGVGIPESEIESVTTGADHWETLDCMGPS